MKYYRRRYRRRYTYCRNCYMKNRKQKTFTRRDRPFLIIGVVVLVCIALYVLGATNELIVQILSLGLLVSAIIYAFYKIIRSIYREARSLRRLYSRKAGKDVDTMSGVEFEGYIARVLKSRGCTDVSLTEQYDLGVDIIATKNGVTWGIQTKRYTGLVGVSAVRQAVTALKNYSCDRAMVITNSTEVYSRPAKELASSNNCILVDRKILAGWIRDYDSGKTGALHR